MLGIISLDINRCDKIITELIEYSSDICLDIEACSPKSILTGTMSKIQMPDNINLVDRTFHEPSMLADVGKIQQVFRSIVQNG
jgi:hypothetical protein